MRPFSSFALMAAFGLALASPSNSAHADRGAADSGGFELSSSDLEQVTKDDKGREIRREIQHFTPLGDLKGITTWTHDFEDGRPIRTTRLSEGPDRELKGRMVEVRHYKRTGIDRIVREWTNGEQVLTRHEEAVYTRDKDANTLLITTTVRNGQRELLETRYTVVTNIRNHFHSSDTSVFNADDVQTSRHLSEWRDNTVERWTFDENDDITRHEVETQQKDAQGRVLVSNTEIFGAARVKIGARDRRMDYSGPQGALKLSVTTWYDASDQATQRETVRHVHERGSITRRVRWERWNANAE